MDVRILGPLEVWVAGRSLALGGTKQRAVLAMLVLHANQVVAIDHLVDGLWARPRPTAPPTSCRSTSHGCARRWGGLAGRLGRLVRQADRPGGQAPPSWPAASPATCCNWTPTSWTWPASSGSPTRVPKRSAGCLNWRRPGWARRPCGVAGRWRSSPTSRSPKESARLAEQHLAVLQARIEADLALGRHAELVAELQALVAEYPLQEGLHRQLLLSLYRSGRQAEALEAYQRTRKLLAEELGIDPGHALQELQGAILAQDRPWTGPQPTESKPTVGPGRTGVPRGRLTGRAAAAADQLPTARFPDAWNVPLRNPHFTGRAGLLEQPPPAAARRRGTLVVQALYGLGGVGKTQLAIEYAHRFAADYDLVWWVNAEQPALIGDQLAQLADKLGLPTRASVAGTIELVLGELRRRSGWLLVFDNAERPQHLAPYQPGGAGTCWSPPRLGPGGARRPAGGRRADPPRNRRAAATADPGVGRLAGR